MTEEPETIGKAFAWWKSRALAAEAKAEALALRVGELEAAIVDVLTHHMFSLSGEAFGILAGAVPSPLEEGRGEGTAALVSPDMTPSSGASAETEGP